MRDMATMSMNKVIHAAIRRDLERFLGALTTFRDGDAGRAHQLGVAWQNFDAQLTDHHEGEHAIAWPHLERAGVSRELLDRMDAEHEAMATALGRTRTAMAALQARPGSGEAANALSTMQQLRDVTLEHLDHEEDELEAFYLDNVDHPEVKAMGREFGRDGGVAKGGRFFAWVTDGATPEERQAIEGSVPKPVLKALVALFGRGYRKEVAPVWRAQGPD
jgi:hypothetical protein